MPQLHCVRGRGALEGKTPHTGGYLVHPYCFVRSFTYSYEGWKDGWSMVGRAEGGREMERGKR
jgi:hypothetical protein